MSGPKINEKLGLRPAGKRSMMKLPERRADAAWLTSQSCPNCGRRGQAGFSQVLAGGLRCLWCEHRWRPEAVPAKRKSPYDDDDDEEAKSHQAAIDDDEDSRP